MGKKKRRVDFCKNTTSSINEQPCTKVWARGRCSWAGAIAYSWSSPKCCFALDIPGLRLFYVANKCVLHEVRPTSFADGFYRVQLCFGRFVFTEGRRYLPRNVGYVRVKFLRELHLQHMLRRKYSDRAQRMIFAHRMDRPSIPKVCVLHR